MDLNTIMIGSADVGRLRTFYSGLFGEPGWEGGGYSGWSIGSGMLMIGPHDQVQGTNREPGRLIWNVQTPDVQGEFTRMTAAGAAAIREPYHPGEEPEMWIATLADPDGNYFQLASPMM